MNSFLDNDFYNFTMAQFIWKYYPNLKVGYKFTNRSSVKLLSKLSVDSVVELLSDIPPRPTIEDIKYLESLNLFDKEFLYDLLSIEQPAIKVEKTDNKHNMWPMSEYPPDELTITYYGNWWESVFLETPILSRLAEQHNLLTNIQKDTYRIGIENFAIKMEFLKQHPYLNFTEFGSRRRASKGWQKEVVEMLMWNRPYQFQGTSNVALAQEFDLPAIGTMGHQIFMVIAAYREHNPVIAYRAIQSKWREMYAVRGAMTLLTDTFGSDHHIACLNDVDLDAWNSYRQDSGDPVAWGRKLLKRFKDSGIDPRSKMLIFSDGLTPQKMLDIWGQFGTITNVSFGWGTNLTNDVGGNPLSIIIKPDYVRNDKTVTECIKLSDNLDKATGSDSIVNLYKEKVGYTSTFSEAPIY